MVPEFGSFALVGRRAAQVEVTRGRQWQQCRDNCGTVASSCVSYSSPTPTLQSRQNVVRIVGAKYLPAVEIKDESRHRSDAILAGHRRVRINVNNLHVRPGGPNGGHKRFLTLTRTTP